MHFSENLFCPGSFAAVYHTLKLPEKKEKPAGTERSAAPPGRRDGMITGYRIRVEKSKLTTVKALQSIGFETIAAGDSYNDLGMIQASKAGILFRSTEQIKKDYPELPACETYEELLAQIRKAL